MQRRSIFPHILSLLLVILCSCQRRIDVAEVQGEWAADSAFFYLQISGDSISYLGRPSNRTPPQHQHPYGISGMGAGFWPSSPFFPYQIGRGNELIVHDSNSVADTLGILLLDKGRLLVQSVRPMFRVRLRKLVQDTSLHIAKVQFSTTPCFGNCSVFDVEFTPNAIYVTEPSGKWINGYSLQRHTYRASDDGHFEKIQSALQRGLPRESKLHFERGIEVGNDWPAYALAIFSSDTVVTFRADQFHLAPELVPVVSLLASPRTYAKLHKVDTTILFESRLQLMSDLLDTLSYLEGFDRRKFRAPQFPGGEEALHNYFRRSFPSKEDVRGTLCFTLTVGLDGSTERVVPLMFKSDSPLGQKYEHILLRSPRWRNALWEGKPVRVPVFVCFYNN